MPSPLEEKKVCTLPAVRCPEPLYTALEYLRSRERRKLSDYIREALIEHCKKHLGDETFGDDSAFGQLDDASQSNARAGGFGR